MFTLLQILHTRLDGWIAPTTLICPILGLVLHKIETAEKIKVTKLSKIRQYMYKLICSFLQRKRMLVLFDGAAHSKVEHIPS